MLALAALLTSCSTAKQIEYLQNIDEVQLRELTTKYEARIKKDDLLSIVVSGPDKTVVMPYNLTLVDNATGGGAYNPEQSTLSYLVDNNGEINFPILGKIKVEGMTRSELVKYLTDEISKDVKDPIVYVSFKNYKITILGEVKAPGTYTMDSERINLFQALGKAGDLLLTAERGDIIRVREIDGVPTYHNLDLRDASILNSEYVYMQQNDILYVRPSALRVAAGTAATGLLGTIFSSITTMVSVISLIMTIKNVK